MKDILRKEILKKRKTLPKNEFIEKSKKIQKRLFELEEFKSTQIILFYISYDNEVFTHDMIKESMTLGKQVIVPKSNTQNNTLILSKLTSWDDLEIGAYQILEPKKECIKEISFETIDLIIVPGVVFDCKGNRIGHGKGYYDRLMNNTRDIPHIGLAFEFQIVDNVPVEKHDMAIDKIITEERVISCIW